VSSGEAYAVVGDKVTTWELAFAWVLPSSGSGAESSDVDCATIAAAIEFRSRGLLDRFGMRRPDDNGAEWPTRRPIN
jgi:hypothetical protein